MTQYYAHPSGVRTTIFQVDSSVSCPYPNSACTRATTFYQFVISVFTVPVISLISIYLPAHVVTVSVPITLSFFVPSSYGSPVTYAVFSLSASAFLAYLSHLLICSALIPEGPLERLFRII